MGESDGPTMAVITMCRPAALQMDGGHTKRRFPVPVTMSSPNTAGDLLNVASAALSQLRIEVDARVAGVISHLFSATLSFRGLLCYKERLS